MKSFLFLGLPPDYPLDIFTDLALGTNLTCYHSLSLPHALCYLIEDTNIETVILSEEFAINSKGDIVLSFEQLIGVVDLINSFAKQKNHVIRKYCFLIDLSYYFASVNYNEEKFINYCKDNSIILLDSKNSIYHETVNTLTNLINA